MKCKNCCIGSYLESYFDYGGDDFIFENCIDINKSFFRCLDLICLYSYCPLCGNKNNLERYRKFLPCTLEDVIFR